MGSYIFHLQSEAVLLLASVTQKKNVLKGSGMTLLVVKKKKKRFIYLSSLSVSETFRGFEIWQYELENILQILIDSWSIHTKEKGLKLPWILCRGVQVIFTIFHCSFQVITPNPALHLNALVLSLKRKLVFFQKCKPQDIDKKCFKASSRDGKQPW